MRNRLDPDKGLEALIYVARRLDGNVYASLKALYFADRHHLEESGFLVYGEDYFAPKHGPVPQFAYGVVKTVRGEGSPESKLVSGCAAFAGAFEKSEAPRKRIVATRDADTELFSESDLEALNAGIERVRGKQFDEIKQDSHDAAWRATQENGFMGLETIASSLDDGAELIYHLTRRDDERVEYDD